MVDDDPDSLRLLGHLLESLHERGGELVARLKLRHLRELSGGGVLVPLHQVVIGEQELSRG